MSYARRFTLRLGYCVVILSAIGLTAGCGERSDDESLVTIDAPEMQAEQAAREAEAKAEAEAQAQAEPAADTAPAEQPAETTVAADSDETPAAASDDGSVDVVQTSALPQVQETAVKVPAKDAQPTQAPIDEIADPALRTQVAARFPDSPYAQAAVRDIRPVGTPGDFATPAEPAEPREVKLLVPDQSFQKEGPEGALRVSYDDLDLLKVLNMDPVSLNAVELMPKWLKQLDGKRVRLRGFMYPPYSHTDIKTFVLARDNQICCFGRNPKPYDVLNVVMRKGVTVDYIQNRPFDVVGTFHIELLTYDDKKVDGLYYIDDAIVIDR